jgi:hypothetical protein
MPGNRLHERGATASAQDRDTEASYWLRLNAAEFPLANAETVIGRSDECTVKLSDPAVSRRHARISLERGVLRLEDLGSCHGTFINQRRLQRPTALLSGDQIVIGSYAMYVVCRSPAGLGASAPAGFGIVPRSGVRLIEPGGEFPARDGQDSYQSPSGVSEYLAGPHQAIFPPGMLDTVAATLSSHVDHILNAMARRRPVPDAVVDTAGWYCVKMAQVTQQSRWLGTAIELHLLAGRILREETLDEAIALTLRGIRCDAALVRNYIRKLADADRSLAECHRGLMDRLATLAQSGEP